MIDLTNMRKDTPYNVYPEQLPVSCSLTTGKRHVCRRFIIHVWGKYELYEQFGNYGR